MARDRKRAKQRRDRAGGRRNRDGGLPPSQPIRTEVPGALDHASGEADEFEAAIVIGASGIPATPDALPDASQSETLSEGEIEAEAVSEGDLTEDELQELPGTSASGAGGGAGDVTPERASGAPLRGGNRAIGFLRASWAELHRVQWPDRRQVTQATAVVLGFVAVAGAYLGLADYVAKEIVEAIL